MALPTDPFGAVESALKAALQGFAPLNDLILPRNWAWPEDPKNRKGTFPALGVSDTTTALLRLKPRRRGAAGTNSKSVGRYRVWDLQIITQGMSTEDLNAVELQADRAIEAARNGSPCLGLSYVSSIGLEDAMISEDTNDTGGTQGWATVISIRVQFNFDKSEFITP